MQSSYQGNYYRADEIEEVIEHGTEEAEVVVPDFGDDMPDLENPSKAGGLNIDRKDAPTAAEKKNDAKQTKKESPFIELAKDLGGFIFGNGSVGPDGKIHIGKSIARGLTIDGNKFMFLAILSAFMSEVYFQKFVYEQGVDGLTKFIKAYFGIDLTNETATTVLNIITKSGTALNSIMDFFFLDPTEFTGVFPNGFFNGMWEKFKSMWNNPKYGLLVLSSLLASTPAFLANTYSDVEPIDVPDSQGGNDWANVLLMSGITFGGMFAYLITQGKDTFDGCEHLFNNKDPSIKSYWHHFWNGMAAPVTQTAIIGGAQHVMRGIGGFYMAKRYGENRGYSRASMISWPIFFGIATAAQSGFGRQHKLTQKFIMGPSFSLTKGKEFLLTKSDGTKAKYRYTRDAAITVQYRYDKITQMQLMNEFNVLLRGDCTRFLNVLHPVCLAETSFTGYFSYRALSYLLSLIPQSSAPDVWFQIAFPAVIAALPTIGIGKVYYDAAIRKKLAHSIEAKEKGEEIIPNSKAAFWIAEIAVDGAFFIRTINGIPGTASLCDDYLRGLNEVDQTMIAIPAGTVVGFAGREYYRKGVQNSIQKHVNFWQRVKDHHFPNDPSPSRNPNAIFGNVNVADSKKPLLQDEAVASDKQDERRKSTVPLMPRMSVGGFTGS